MDDLRPEVSLPTSLRKIANVRMNHVIHKNRCVRFWIFPCKTRIHCLFTQVNIELFSLTRCQVGPISLCLCPEWSLIVASESRIQIHCEKIWESRHTCDWTCWGYSFDGFCLKINGVFIIMELINFWRKEEFCLPINAPVQWSWSMQKGSSWLMTFSHIWQVVVSM